MELIAFGIGITIVAIGYALGFYHGSKSNRDHDAVLRAYKTISKKYANALRNLADYEIAEARDVTNSIKEDK